MRSTFVPLHDCLPFVIQANANQRSGRAGRTGPGYDKADSSQPLTKLLKQSVDCSSLTNKTFGNSVGKGEKCYKMTFSPFLFCSLEKGMTDVDKSSTDENISNDFGEENFYSPAAKGN